MYRCILYTKLFQAIYKTKRFINQNWQLSKWFKNSRCLLSLCRFLASRLNQIRISEHLNCSNYRFNEWEENSLPNKWSNTDIYVSQTTVIQTQVAANVLELFIIRWSRLQSYDFVTAVEALAYLETGTTHFNFCTLNRIDFILAAPRNY